MSTTKKKDSAVQKPRSIEDIHKALKAVDSEEIRAFADFRESQAKCINDRRELLHELSWWWLEHQKSGLTPEPTP